MTITSGMGSWLRLVVLVVVLCPVIAPERASGQGACLLPEEASHHIGERGCVEGLVTAVVFARQSTGQPTFLDLGPQFTAVIWSEDRAKFAPVPETWRGRRARISGRIDSYRGKAQIVLREPGQLAPAGQATAVAGAPIATASPPPAATETASPAPAPLSPSATRIPASPGSPATLVPVATGTGVALAPVARSATAIATAPSVTAGKSTTDPPSRTLLLAGVTLLAAGGGGGAWLALRRRDQR